MYLFLEITNLIYKCIIKFIPNLINNTITKSNKMSRHIT